MDNQNYIIWRDKQPLDYRTGRRCDAHNPANRTSFKNAEKAAKRFNAGIGYVFCADDPYFFIDIDNAYDDKGNVRPECAEILERFKGAFVETSQSGRGFHIIGSCDKSKLPKNRRINARAGDTSFDALTTEKRFVALTFDNAYGDRNTVLTDEVLLFVEDKLYRDESEGSGEWTAEPLVGDGISDMDVIDKALGTLSTAAAFGDGVTFAQLWKGDEVALGKRWPDAKGQRPYDASRADMALAQHLAFWTGGNCEQMERIMRMCPGLKREKWDAREDYIRETILRAKNRQSNFYKRQMNSDGKIHSEVLPPSEPVEPPEYGEYLNSIPHNDEEDVPPMPPPSPSVPEDKQEHTINDYCHDEQADVDVKTDKEADADEDADDTPPRKRVLRGKLVTKSRFMTPPEQVDYFQNCVYISECHRVLTPDGTLLKVEAFKAEYGGYEFEYRPKGKTTPDAFKALTQSELATFPKARKMFFDPNAEPWELTRRGINTYLPLDIPSREGDVSLFLNHVEKLLPHESDREILLDYMAACVQRPGDKFQWCPMIQGTEGNGKTLLATVLCNAIGEEYFHTQDPEDLGNVFNAWLERSIIVSVEEIFINARYEMSNRMKAMITNRRSPIHAKGIDQRTAINCAKFLLFSNHKDGVVKHENDRRYAVFFTAQQCRADKLRDGMDSEYFATLYDWVESEEGMAALNWYLQHREVKTRMKGDAPATTSQHEAIFESLGNQERIILEAIDNEEMGMRNGMLGAYFVDNKLRESGYNKVSPKQRGKILFNIGYESAGKVQIDSRRMRLYIHRDSEFMDATPEERNDAWKAFNAMAE